METVWLFLFGICLGFLVSVAYRDVVGVAKYRYNSRVEAIRDMEDRLERYIREVSESNNRSWKSIHTHKEDIRKIYERVDILLDKVECVDRRLHLMDLRATLEEIGRESVEDEWEGEDSE